MCKNMTANYVVKDKICSLLKSFISVDSVITDDKLSENDVSDKNSTKENTGKYLRTRPADFFAFLQRVHSFSSATWLGKPIWLSPPRCARHGWQNVGHDLLQCCTCDATLSGHLPSVTSTVVYVECCTKLNKLLREGHRDICPWKHNFCPESFLSSISAHNRSEAHESFRNRLLQLLTIGDNLPYISRDQLLKLKIDSSLVSIVKAELSAVGEDEAIPFDFPESENRLLSAIVLSLCGWQNGSTTQSIACTFCDRRVGLWNYANLSSSFALLHEHCHVMNNDVETMESCDLTNNTDSLPEQNVNSVITDSDTSVCLQNELRGASLWNTNSSYTESNDLLQHQVPIENELDLTFDDQTSFSSQFTNAKSSSELICHEISSGQIKDEMHNETGLAVVSGDVNGQSVIINTSLITDQRSSISKDDETVLNSQSPSSQSHQQVVQTLVELVVSANKDSNGVVHTNGSVLSPNCVSGYNISKISNFQENAIVESQEVQKEGSHLNEQSDEEENRPAFEDEQELMTSDGECNEIEVELFNDNDEPHNYSSSSEDTDQNHLSNVRTITVNDGADYANGALGDKMETESQEIITNTHQNEQIQLLSGNLAADHHTTCSNTAADIVISTNEEVEQNETFSVSSSTVRHVDEVLGTATEESYRNSADQDSAAANESLSYSANQVSLTISESVENVANQDGANADENLSKLANQDSASSAITSECNVVTTDVSDNTASRSFSEKSAEAVEQSGMCFSNQSLANVNAMESREVQTEESIDNNISGGERTLKRSVSVQYNNDNELQLLHSSSSLEQITKRPKMQNDDPKQFDALCEHKSWCAWVASYGRSSFSPVGNTAIKDDNQTGGEVPPGWRRLLTYLLPKPASHSEPWKTPNYIGLRSIRHLFREAEPSNKPFASN